MEVQKYLEKMILIQNQLLRYLDNKDSDEDEFQHLIKLYNDQKIFHNKHLLRSSIHLLSSLIDNHHRSVNFYDRIFKIILSFKEIFKKYYSNFQLYDFFKNNDKIILFLSEEKIIFFDKLIVSKMIYTSPEDTKELSQQGKYLFPEIKHLIDENSINIENIPKDIEEIRKTEYGDNYILQLIQKDLINEFLLYISQTNYPLYNQIQPSIFESNFFLTTFRKVNLLQYSAFFGSIKIFKYLIKQDYPITSDLLLFAIHGRNSEIIHILDDYEINLDEKALKDCLKDSIHCHHNELTNYLIKNYFEDDEISSFVLKESLKSYNFALIQPELINSDILYLLCKRDYFIFVNKILHDCNDIDINWRILKEYNFEDDEIKKQKTLLFYAAENGNLEIVELLLQHKDIDVNKKSYINLYNISISEPTPLNGAIQNGNVKIIQQLLKHKDININLKSLIDENEQTPLVTAIKNSNIEAVRILIERNDLDINLKSLDYSIINDQTDKCFHTELTPLYKAVENNEIEIVQLLLDHKNIDINTIITIRIDVSYFDFPENKKVSYSTFYERTALFKAIFSNKTEIALLLLSRENINVDMNPNKYLLHTAVMNKNTVITKILIANKNIDINEKYTNKKNHNLDIWDEEDINATKINSRNDNRLYFQKYGYSMTSSISQCYFEKTALFLAVENNDSEIVRILINNDNIDVNLKSTIKKYNFNIEYFNNEEERKDLKEMTPLYLAVQNENIEIVKMLVEHKDIDINLKSSFYYWHCKGTLDLQTHQFKIDEIKEESKEETPLHIAVSKGNVSIVKTLLRNKNININATDIKGRKPIELTQDKEIRSLFNQQY